MQGFLSQGTELIEGIFLHKISKSPKHAMMAKKIFQFFTKSLPGVLPNFRTADYSFAFRIKPDISVISGR